MNDRRITDEKARLRPEEAIEGQLLRDSKGQEGQLPRLAIVQLDRSGLTAYLPVETFTLRRLLDGRQPVAERFACRKPVR